MTKADLGAQVATNSRLTKQEAEMVVQTVLDTGDGDSSAPNRETRKRMT